MDMWWAALDILSPQSRPANIHPVGILQSGGEAELAMEMWWRAAALDALQAYVVGPLSRAEGQEAARLQRTIALLLAPTLEATCSHAAMQVCYSRSTEHLAQTACQLFRNELVLTLGMSLSLFLGAVSASNCSVILERNEIVWWGGLADAGHDRLQDPTKAKGSSSGMFSGAAAMLQLRLLETYLALPSCAAFAPQHEALTKLCSRSLRGASTASTGAARAIACSALFHCHVCPPRVRQHGVGLAPIAWLLHSLGFEHALARTGLVCTRQARRWRRPARRCCGSWRGRTRCWGPTCQGGTRWRTRWLASPARPAARPCTPGRPASRRAPAPVRLLEFCFKGLH